MAKLTSIQKAETDFTGKIDADSATVTVKSVQTTDPGATETFKFTIYEDRGMDQEADFTQGMANVYIFTAGVGGATFNLSSATAFSESTNSAHLKVKNLDAGAVNAEAGGRSVAKASIDNVAAGVATQAVLVGFAIAGGTFSTTVEALSGGTWNVGDLTIKNDYVSLAQATVTPASAGVQASFANIGVNAAVAINRTTATAEIKGAGTINADIVTMSSEGNSHATAEVKSPKVTVAALNLVANVVVAFNRTTQKVLVTGTNINADSLTVTSNINNNDTDSTAGALAVVGGAHDGSKSVEISYYSGQANVAVADFGVTNWAVAENAAFDIGGDLSFTVNSKSYADATVATGNSIGMVSAVLTVVTSFADGNFKASIGTKGRKIKAQNITVSNIYSARSESTSAVASEGVSAHLADIGVNVSYSKASPTAEASVKGEGSNSSADAGTDDDPGDISVSVKGTATANAGFIRPTVSVSGIKIAVNVVLADLTGTQSAIISGLAVKAGSVTILSEFNKDLGTNAAEALQGVGGQGDSKAPSVSLGGLSIKVNTARARASFTSGAYADKSTFDVDGAVNIDSNGNAIAHAGITTDTAEISIVGVGVMVTEARADAQFLAKMTNCSGKIGAGSLHVGTDYTATARAETLQPEGGVSASLVSVGVNSSTAVVGAVSEASVSGTGYMDVDGDVEVIASGNISATATVKQGTTLTSIKVAVNNTKSTLSANQKAFINLTGTGNEAESVSVTSQLISASSKAITGTTRGAKDVSLVGISSNTAEASSTTINTAYIQGGSWTVEAGKAAGDVTVAATTGSTVTAEAQRADRKSVV